MASCFQHKVYEAEPVAYSKWCITLDRVATAAVSSIWWVDSSHLDFPEM